MKRMAYLLILLFITTCIMESALAQGLIIYPAKGQSQEQMEKDKFECHSWAKQQTGFDPMVASNVPQQPSTQSQGSVAGGAVKGAAGGALLGAGIGAVAGDASKGAAIGAASGGGLGGIRSRKQKKQMEQAQQQQVKQQSVQYNQKQSEYNRAYSACLEAKGYTVK
ncbi:MAG: YMGG-like glycine zipper-containing protein [Candidatus Jettenia sp.]|nr:MAG: YMGG-like glycine zipper-containing protein [Candidatus Jettenia sp.]